MRTMQTAKTVKRQTGNNLYSGVDDIMKPNVAFRIQSMVWARYILHTATFYQAVGSMHDQFVSFCTPGAHEK